MASADIDGSRIAFEIIGTRGPGWVVTPGGRFSKDAAGIRQLAERLAGRGHRVVIWDRPNTGASDVRFDGVSESEMQADVLAGLLRHVDLHPAVIVGGSGGARVSLLAAARHPEVSRGLAMLWISGGVYGLIQLGVVYSGESIRAAWTGGMEAVVELPEWAEVLDRNPANRERFLALEPRAFIETMERWMLAYCPKDGVTVPGVSDSELAAMRVPTLVFRGGKSDPHHPRFTSERLADLIPSARLVEPPWGDREWTERMEAARTGKGQLFERWPLLADQLLDFESTLPGG